MAPAAVLTISFARDRLHVSVSALAIHNDRVLCDMQTILPLRVARCLGDKFLPLRGIFLRDVIGAAFDDACICLDPGSTKR
ncbi:MAG: hypothetical protein ACREPU_03850 [Rhodanobacteraceae bacterium]